MVSTKIVCTLALTMAVFSSTASAKPVPKAEKVTAADTPTCDSANNGAWQCIPDRAQCYLGVWKSYPCAGGTVCDPATGQCGWDVSPSTTTPKVITTTTDEPKPPKTTAETETHTRTKTKTRTRGTKTASIPVPENTGSAKFVTYIDNTAGHDGGAVFDIPGTVAKNAYNVVNLAFWQSFGPWDTAFVWNGLSDSVRQDYIAKLHANGVKILVSAFGAAEAPTSAGVNPTTVAKNLAAFVKKNGLDGADIDWEDNNAMEAGTGEEWLITFTKALRAQLPSPRYIITHAPQAPYFVVDAAKYPKGAYVKVHKEVGNIIDWYNMQWYNQGSSTYDSCDSLLHKANGWATGTSVFELIARGIPQHKLVIGKPVTPAGATNTGYMEVGAFASCLKQAKAKGWNAGVMGWQFTLDSGSWINTLASAF